MFMRAALSAVTKACKTKYVNRGTTHSTVWSAFWARSPIGTATQNLNTKSSGVPSASSLK